MPLAALAAVLVLAAMSAPGATPVRGATGGSSASGRTVAQDGRDAQRNHGPYTRDGSASAPRRGESPNERPSEGSRIPRPEPVEPIPAKKLEKSIRRGVDFLLESQNESGSWGSPISARPEDVYAPVPGAHHAFRAATTGLCIAALIELDDQRPQVSAALDRAEQWLLKHASQVRRAEPRAVYNTWGHIYTLDALTRMYERHADQPERLARIRKEIELQIGRLQQYEYVGGGWGYYDFNIGSQHPGSPANSFTTAAGLIALKQADRLDLNVPGRLVDRAVASVERQQKPDFSYLYAESHRYNPMHGVNRPAGSLGRSQACNAALRLWGAQDITDGVLRDWLDRLFARNGWLDIGRKRPIPHESWFAVAGYFFYFGHYYAGECIALLPPEEQPTYQDHLAHVLLAVQEKDGSWWDFPMFNYHKQYGTAFALRALSHCRREGE